MKKTKHTKREKLIMEPGAVQVQVDETLARLTAQYQHRTGWLLADIIHGAAECGLMMVLDPGGHATADIGSLFSAATDRAARRRFRRVPGSVSLSPDQRPNGGVLDGYSGEQVSAPDLVARLQGCENGRLVPLSALGLDLEQSTVEKDGVILRPHEDARTWGGKRTRCGCLYQVPAGWSLSDPPPRAEDIRWLEWPKEDGGQAVSPKAVGRVIGHPERSPEHVSFRVELPDGRHFQGGMRGVLQVMSGFNRENGWPDEADQASIWKPAPDGEGMVLDFEAMEERERQCRCPKPT